MSEELKADTGNTSAPPELSLQPGQLRIHYAGRMKPDLEALLEAALKRFGYIQWASGRNLITGVRDLAFDVVPEAPGADVNN